ncbi:hypothetical protein NQ176_g236 [Zarea fungicola]|uniref:Uncharacterized protein n=1 Tax=Zarea fungicola TaxID=93591 RepID=A0ACC1P062_9HYPO|nr:hypothetical protein NQ176_g236 [Lecanicillium fungicola]
MPLPKDAVTVTGGCNCGAIRYKIAIPPASERPAHFAVSENDRQEAPPCLPMVVVDHCNDCRRATSSILPSWILTPETMFTLSCLTKQDSPATGYTINKSALRTENMDKDDTWPDYTPGYDIMCGRDEDARLKTWLCIYTSTEAQNSPYGANSFRSFCGRCGTNVAYIVDPFPLPTTSRMIDVILGTTDRKWLENSALEPERQLWWSCGVSWIQRLANGKLGPKHPYWNPLEQQFGESS